MQTGLQTFSVFFSVEEFANMSTCAAFQQIMLIQMFLLFFWFFSVCQNDVNLFYDIIFFVYRGAKIK